ncbi:AsmA family protein [Hyphobacterium sp. HN65]|uniref:AsmA family protein n=1 Tax=Hyphobacterium lacteum TaxID=3116575 RepID=A0ABU7LV18_9PROT|nr:AsmA family protein [Hyphobacterium sp. HN65]MEE2527174.1 AsmA family protein [Hyphobacterium sp. HN65]
MIRRILSLVVFLAVLIVLAAIILPFVIPESVYRDQAQQAASQNLGRDVTLSGDVSLRILPRVEIQAKDVTIANEDGFGEAAFAEMAEMRVGVQLWPLLSRNVVIEEFVLVEPTIRLQQRGGRNNWSLGPVTDEAQAPPAASEGFVRRPGALPFEASLGDIRIIDGFISYSDGAQERQIEGLDVRIHMPGLDQPLEISGGLSADGEAMTLAAYLGSLRGFFEGEEVIARIDLGGDLIDLGFDGVIPAGEDLRYNGLLNANIPSIRALASFAGSPLPDGDGLERFELAGQLSGGLETISLDASGSNGRIRLDDIRATGRLAADLSGARPSLSGALNVPQLDLTRYIPVAPDTSSSSSGVPPWSEERIDLSSLGLVDANLDLSVDQLQIQDIEISDAALTLALVNSRLEANLTRISLYDGSGTATIVANNRTATPSFRIAANLQSIAAGPLLEAAAGFDRLSGTGRINIDLLTSGHSQSELMNALGGNGSFAFADGAIRGVNLARAIRGIESALTTRQLPDGFGEQQQTDFSALEGTFTVSNGVATNNDLILLSPLVRVDGAGTIDIGGQTMDYRLRPRAVASIEGQGGDRDLRGVVVPIIIRGSFNNPSVGIDWDVVGRALLQGAVQGAVNGQNPEDAIRNALGSALGLGGNNQDDTGDSDNNDNGEEATDPAETLIRGLFGRGRTNSDDNDDDDGGQN